MKVKVTKFEDLDIWKKSKKLTTEIFLIMNKSKEYGFKDQITRAALSIPSNIAEGYERGTNKEYIRFLNIARGSCGEVRTQLYIYSDIGLINKEVGEKLIKETKEISAKITSLIIKRQQFEK